jgi:hypothetical protein
VDGSISAARSVGFLFNHDQVHQVAHSAPVAFELSRMNPGWQVTLIACSDAESSVLTEVAKRFPGHLCKLIRISPSGALGRLGSLIDGLAPLRKVSMLKSNLQFFRQFDALVVPEKTSLLLRTRFGLDHIRMIHTRHGAGDRAVGFDGHSGQFDLVLLAGEKIRRRLADAGQLRDGHYAVVGYPKFDAVDAFSRKPARLFDNDRPTVLYNPHCSPHLSSWYHMGLEILEHFHRSGRYNLIFAPHVMLYRRRLQISIDRFGIAWAAAIPQKYRDCPHIHIDTGSGACADMSYTLAADIYLGDVSSQVCEFLVKPRPCLFANPHRVRWSDDPCYAAWHLGPVFESVNQLGAKLEQAESTHERYLGLQRRYFQETFDLSGRSSSSRAASAVSEFLQRDPPPRPARGGLHAPPPMPPARLRPLPEHAL